MSLFAGQSTTYKYTVLFGASVTLCIIVGLACAVLVHLGMGHWIELFNGATWPTAFSPTETIDKGGLKSPYTFWFYLVLAVRTLINLGIVLSAVLALSWLVAGGLERIVMSKLVSVFRTQNVLLAQKLLQMLEDRRIEVPEPVEAELLKAAREFGTNEMDRFLHDRVKEAASA
jgi:hypothetical protein